MLRSCSSLPAGPWSSEKDQRVWMDGVLACAVVRQPMGHLCGYVGVPASHPWYGKHYDAIDCDVHGGLTFAADVLPASTVTGLWWVGFDCAHYGDLVPSMARDLPWDGAVYRTLEWVCAEVAHLAAQADAARINSGS